MPQGVSPPRGATNKRRVKLRVSVALREKRQNAILTLQERQACSRVTVVPGPAQLPEDYEDYDSGQPGGYNSPADRAELAKLLGLDRPAHFQGVSIAASHDHYDEYIARAEGRQPAKVAQPYWD